MSVKFASLGLIFTVFALTFPVRAEPSDAARQDLASFFAVNPMRISVECPQNSFWLDHSSAIPVLNICLNKSDNQKRCEIIIHDLPKTPSRNEISYELKYSDPIPRKRWKSVMQIHSFPDPGEAWRCPPLSLEVKDGAFRLFNRWDRTALSNVSGNDCTEAGSTISERTVLSGISVNADKWQSVKIDTILSSSDNGLLQASIDGTESPLLTGPNIFNDRKPNFLKFGVYNPAGFEEGHHLVCVKYRNIRIINVPN